MLKEIIIKLLNKHAPVKYKYLRGNHGKFVTKDLRKAIMKRSRLKNVYNKNKTDSSKTRYNQQRNICTNLLRKAKSSYFQKLHPSSINDNKSFWKTVKPAFSDKIKTQETITLIYNDNIIAQDQEVANTFNNFFCKCS